MPPAAGDPIERFWSKLDRTGDCWLWTASVNKKGYGKFKFVSYCLKIAHRFAWEIFNGPIPNGACVLHKCDRPRCCNPDHLFLGTRGDNAADMAAKRRSTWGERHPGAKLDWTKVRAIRAAKRDGVPERTLARRYGIAYQNINRIVRGELWKEA